MTIIEVVKKAKVIVKPIDVLEEASGFLVSATL